MKNASDIINATSPRILQNYFLWHFMMHQAGNMPRNIRFIREQYERIFEDARTPPPRTIRCGFYVNEHMGFVVSKLYIKTYFDDTARNQVLRYFNFFKYHIIGI